MTYYIRDPFSHMPRTRKTLETTLKPSLGDKQPDCIGKFNLLYSLKYCKKKNEKVKNFSL